MDKEVEDIWHVSVCYKIVDKKVLTDIKGKTILLNQKIY